MLDVSGMIDVSRFGAEDMVWAREVLTRRWGEPRVVSCGRLHHADRLPGFVGWLEDQRQGLVTYRLADGACEIVTLDSLAMNVGIGTALVEAVVGDARRAACQRVFAVTTNDNTPALLFYQRRGFRLVSLRIRAVDEARRLKPSIPQNGRFGIPLRDELELELPL